MRFLSMIILVLMGLSADASTYNITVVYGDKRTNFEIELESSKGVVNLINSNGRKSIDLSPNNASFLAKHLGDIFKLKSNDASLCSRNYIHANRSGKSVVGCIGSPTPVAQELSKIVDLLNTAFLIN